MWFNHKLQGFYMCHYDFEFGYQSLLEHIDDFKEDHFSILLSLVRDEAPKQVIFDSFVRSDSLAVWYQLDKELKIVEGLNLRKDQVNDEQFTNKFKQLMASFKPD